MAWISWTHGNVGYVSSAMSAPGARSVRWLMRDGVEVGELDPLRIYDGSNCIRVILKRSARVQGYGVGYL